MVYLQFGTIHDPIHSKLIKTQKKQKHPFNLSLHLKQQINQERKYFPSDISADLFQ